MLLSRWLFPGAGSNPRAENAILFSAFHERLRNAPPKKTAEDADAPLLEAHDAAAVDEYLNEAINNVPIDDLLEIKKKQMRENSPLYNGTRARRAFAWLVLLCYLTVIYVGVFYLFSFLSSNSLHAVDMLSLTATNAYANLAQTYQSITNPATPQQVADIMLEFYELLAEMGYYDASLIARPPHIQPSINKTLAAELKFSQASVEMMEILPYLNINGNTSAFNWEAGLYGNEFLLRGIFADLRAEEDMKVSRDPWFFGVDESKDSNEDGGLYMLPDYVSLSLLGDEGTMMVLNVRNSVCTPPPPMRSSKT